MSDKRPSWLHTASDRHYVTVAPHDGAVPSVETFTLRFPLPNGQELRVQGNEAAMRDVARQVARWLTEMAEREPRECQRACCLAAPALPGFERLVA